MRRGTVVTALVRFPGDATTKRRPVVMVSRDAGFPVTTKPGPWKVKVDGFPFDRQGWVVVNVVVPLVQPRCTGACVDEDTMSHIMTMRDAWLRKNHE